VKVSAQHFCIVKQYTSAYEANCSSAGATYGSSQEKDGKIEHMSKRKRFMNEVYVPVIKMQTGPRLPPDDRLRSLNPALVFNLQLQPDPPAENVKTNGVEGSSVTNLKSHAIM